jgi:putative endonuclease
MEDHLPRTLRQKRGSWAESLVAHALRAQGWQIVAANVRVGRDEIDLLAIDPGPPPELVSVEVRSATSTAFGTPEERIDRAKVGHLYRALRGLRVDPGLSFDARLPRRVDLVVVDRRLGGAAIRHIRRLEPP